MNNKLDSEWSAFVDFMHTASYDQTIERYDLPNSSEDEAEASFNQLDWIEAVGYYADDELDPIADIPF